MQIGNMGGIAVRSTCASRPAPARLPESSILLLLDREADRFLAKRADADGELVKPIDPGTLRKAVDGLARCASYRKTIPPRSVKSSRARLRSSFYGM